jgi:MtfA peptidase
MRWLREWRKRRIMHAWQPDARLWKQTLSLPVLSGLTPAEQERLREKVILFLHDKSFTAAMGTEVTEPVRLQVAAQACLLSLNLDERVYEGWSEIILYPDEFVPHRQIVDEHGVVHETRYPMMGEAWHGGPVIFSAADVGTSAARDGVNVVLHEFAHKLDMQNGAADGLPVLHADMRVRDWADAFGAAYDDFCRRVEAGEDTVLDPYASEAPAEFFAVLTEVFFETPVILADTYPDVYQQMRLYFRQHPISRHFA